MGDYFNLFFEGTSQLSSLALVGVIWFALAALGSRVAGSTDRVLYPFYGWGLVVVVYIAVGTLSDIGFTSIALGLGLVAIISAAAYLRRDRWLIDPCFLRMLVWAAPLLVLVSAMAGSQWDEFSHWLLGQKYLLQVDHFPSSSRPKSAASYPAYPYAWQLLAYFVGRLHGGIVENAAPLFNVLLLLSLGHVAVHWALRISGGNGGAALSPWLTASLACAVATIANPTFVQKVILTAYADTATSVTLAIGVYLGWACLQALSENNLSRARGRALLAGLVFAVLVSLKQSTMELFGLALIAFFICGLFRPKVKLAELTLCAVLTAAPVVLVYGMWRHYVANELSGREFVIRPFADWDIALLPSIIGSMITVLLKKSAYMIAMILAIVVGIRSLWGPSTPYGQAMLCIALIFMGHTAFLMFCYVAVFSGHEAKTIASYWRYNQQLGGLAVFSITMTLGVVIHRYKDRVSFAKLRWLPAVLVIAGPLVFAEKLRFDKEPSYLQYRDVGKSVAEIIERDATVWTFDPKGSGESGTILRYEVSDVTHNVGYQAAFHDMSSAALSKLVGSVTSGYFVVHSVTPDVQKVFEAPLNERVSYLIKKSGDRFELIKSWPWPSDDS